MTDNQMQVLRDVEIDLQRAATKLIGAIHEAGNGTDHAALKGMHCFVDKAREAGAMMRAENPLTWPTPTILTRS